MRRTARVAAAVNPYGVELKGFHRGPQCHIPEPLDQWVTVLGDAMPFYHRCLLVLPPSHSPLLQAAVLRRAQEHFGSVHVTVPVPRRQGAPHDGTRGPSWQIRMDVAPPATGAPVDSSLYDIIVFHHNAFGDCCLFDAPTHITNCYKALRPHGLLALCGSRRLRVVGPDPARYNYESFVDSMTTDFAALLQSLRFDGQSWDALNGVSSRWEYFSDSCNNAHMNLLLPFTGVQRRWFCSEFDITIPQLVAHVRTWPEYQVLARRSSDSKRTSILSSLLGARVVPQGDSANGDEVAAVQREPYDVDPLHALEHALVTADALNAPDKRGSVRVAADQFVVSCDRRPLSSLTDRFEPLDQLGR